jgi:hypothetical protein
MGMDIIAWNTSNIKSTGKCPMGSVLSVCVVHQGKGQPGDSRLLEADKLVMKRRDRPKRLNSTRIIPHHY